MALILPRVLEPASKAITALTRYCAVLGHPVKHSASPAMHNAALAVLELDWRYLAFDVHPDDLSQAISGAKVMKFIGLNLTVPHKLLAMQIVDELDTSAQMWGAVNTVSFEARSENGEWRPSCQLPAAEICAMRSRGFNTDADAIISALGAAFGLDLTKISALLLGAGGAGRVAALRLAAADVKELFLVNRTISKADQIAQEIRNRFPGVPIHIGYPPGSVDLVLNATSLGLNDNDPLPFDINKLALTQVKAVFDMIYRPAETKLLHRAKEAGCLTANGLGMLLYQGAKALEIWSGKTAPMDVMAYALKENVYGK